jgi:hypothetical protein
MPEALTRRLAAASPGSAPVRFSPLLFAAFLIAAFAINYPGRLNEDSLWQFIGWSDPALMTDLHSPFVAWLWSLPAPFLGQPQSALLVQSAVLAIFAATVPAERPKSARQWAALAIEMLVKLILLIAAGAIIKDILLIGLLLSGFAALQLARSGGRARFWLATGLILFALSLTIRPTNIVMPVVAAMAVIPLLGRPGRRGLAWGAAAAAAVLLLVPAQIAANRWVFQARSGHTERQVQMFDMAGISALTGRDQFARIPGWPVGTLPAVEDCYTPNGWDPFAGWGRCSGYWRAMDSSVQRIGRRRIAALWLGGIVENPGAYARHRLGFMARLLTGPDPSFYGDHFRGLAPSQRGLHLYALNSPERIEEFRRNSRGLAGTADLGWWRGNPVNRILSAIVGPFFRTPWLAALAIPLALLLIAWTWLRRRAGRAVDLIVPAAAGVAIGNALMHLAIGLTSQDRYLYPTLYCALFALIAALRIRDSAAGVESAASPLLEGEGMDLVRRPVG